MSDVIHSINNHVFTITLNRSDKHNCFNDHLIHSLHSLLEKAIQDPNVRVILLNANGNHFSAGADIAWMQRMAQASEEKNYEDALTLSNLMHTLYHCPKPTIAAVQGVAYGGGAGLVAACDVAIGDYSARFCFSEVKLGLIPAVISPFVIKAVGERLAKWLFLSAYTFDAKEAFRFNLLQFVVDGTKLQETANNYAKDLSQLAPEAQSECKKLVNFVSEKPIDNFLKEETARLIAIKRVSKEGQTGLNAFLKKEQPKWN